jgi:membrane-bound lytic murein transglycosylase B
MTKVRPQFIRWALGAGVAVLTLSGCATNQTTPKVTQPAKQAVTQPTTADRATFQSWLMDVRQEAAAKGISQATLAQAFDGISEIPRVIELDRRQPEFTQTFWRYLDSAVSEARVRDGIAKLNENQALLVQLEKTYGVPGRYLVAFWGMETNYGRTLGGFRVPTALATLAFDGRRSAFFRTELFDALKIIDQGHITVDRMVGSWAGAMGQTQFMPSTFLRHAVDITGDGRIDVWGQTADALGSGAHYLQNLGWDPNRSWGREVRLPKGFDLTLASLDGGAAETLKPLSAWAKLGLTRADGRALPNQDVAAALILPSGQEGPAFLVYDNFRIILKWNRSISYALAVGHLADRITGAGNLAASRVNEDPLTRNQVVDVQRALNQFGYLDARPDGTLGSGTRRALRTYQLACGLPADGYVGQKAVGLLAADMAVGQACVSKATPGIQGVASNNAVR